MITKEVREWLKKVECMNYSYEDAMQDLAEFSKFLSKEDLIFIKNKLQNLQ